MEEKNTSLNLEQKLDQLCESVKNIEKTIVVGRHKSIIQGIWGAIGYVIGLIIAIVIGGWLLTIIGHAFGFDQQVQSVKDALYRR